MTKAVVFDMDGVLFDSEQLYLNIWRKIAKQYHIPHIDEILYQCLGKTAANEREMFLSTYGDDFPYDDYVSIVKEDFFAYVSTYNMPLKPGCVELIKYLKQNHYLIGLATSTKKDAVFMELKGVGLFDYFDVIVTGDMLTRSKPAPDIYLRACSLLKVDPADTWAVEDSENGIRAAYAANMKVLMVPDLMAPQERFQQMITYIGDSLFDVITYLDSQ